MAVTEELNDLIGYTSSARNNTRIGLKQVLLKLRKLVALSKKMYGFLSERAMRPRTKDPRKRTVSSSLEARPWCTHYTMLFPVAVDGRANRPMTRDEWPKHVKRTPSDTRAAGDKNRLTEGGKASK